MALAAHEVERHAQPPVDPVEFPQAVLDERLPEFPVLRVALLQLHQLRAGRVEPGRLFLRPLVALHVNPLELLDRRGLVGRRVGEVPEAHDQQPELRAPVAQVVVGDHAEPEEPVQPVERVADDRGPDVPDVHRLGHVGTGVIQDHGFPAARLGRPEAGIARELLQPAGHPVRVQEKVHEPGAGDLGLLHGFRPRGGGQDGGDFAGWFFQRLGQGHGGIALVVAELLVGGRHHGQGQPFRQRPGEGRLEGVPRPVRKQCFDCQGIILHEGTRCRAESRIGTVNPSKGCAFPRKKRLIPSCIPFSSR